MDVDAKEGNPLFDQAPSREVQKFSLLNFLEQRTSENPDLYPELYSSRPLLMRLMLLF